MLMNDYYVIQCRTGYYISELDINQNLDVTYTATSQIQNAYRLTTRNFKKVTENLKKYFGNECWIVKVIENYNFEMVET